MALTALLNSLCTIQTLSTSVNSIGEAVLAYSGGTPYICRINPLRGNGESMTGAKVASTNQYRLYLESATTITERHRVVSAGITYNVKQVNSMPGARVVHHLEVDIERVR